MHCKGGTGETDRGRELDQRLRDAGIEDDIPTLLDEQVASAIEEMGKLRGDDREYLFMSVYGLKAAQIADIKNVEKAVAIRKIARAFTRVRMRLYDDEQRKAKQEPLPK